MLQVIEQSVAEPVAVDFLELQGELCRRNRRLREIGNLCPHNVHHHFLIDSIGHHNDREAKCQNTAAAREILLQCKRAFG